MTPTTPHRNGSRWAGPIVTVVLAVLTVTVQWGVVTAKLSHLEQRVEELIVETRALRNEYQAIERRVSYMEGMFSRIGTSKTPAGGDP